MPDIDYGGFFTDDDEDKPKKRPRTRAREVEQPSAKTGVDDADPPDYGGFFSEHEGDAPAAAPGTDLKHGTPPGGASARTGDWQRPHEPAWYESLLESTQSAAQGAALNLGDEAAAGAQWVGDKLGITHSGNSYAENADLYKKDADRVTSAYPYGHGAGQMATGMAFGMAAAPGKLAQGATQGALSAASEFADSRDLNDPWGTAKRTAGAGALGFGSGVVGSWAGDKLARGAATSPVKAFDRWAEGVGGVHEPVRMPTSSGPPPRPSKPDAGYALGEFDMRPAQPLPRAPEVPEAERMQLALKGAADKVRPNALEDLLKAGTTVSALTGNPVAAGGFRGAQALNRMRSPGLKDIAIQEGTAVPDQRWGAAGRMGAEAAWELGAPGVTGGKVNAQDADPAAMRAAEGWSPTRLSPGEEAQFKRDMMTGEGYQQWREEFEKQWDTKVDFDDPTGDYDYRGAWKAGIRPSRYQYDDDKYHWASSTPDGRMLKAPDHPTAWMEHFMRRTGVDPGSIGLKNQAQGKAYEDEKIAYADAPTLNYALSETLHMGTTGLSPQDEQALTSAVVKGDDKAIAATDFRLRQRYPAYARAVEKSLRGLNEEDD